MEDMESYLGSADKSGLQTSRQLVLPWVSFNQEDSTAAHHPMITM